MVKKKSNVSLFSTLMQQTNPEPSSAEYHLIDNEYFAAFNTLNDIQEFHNKINENQPINHEEDTDLQTESNDNEMDMKTFAQQFLIDSPEHLTTSSDMSSIDSSSKDSYKRKETTSSIESSNKRQRRNIRDLPQSSNFIFMSDDDNGNIFNSLQEKKSSRSKRIAYEDISAILLTLDVKQKKKKHLSRNNHYEPTIAIEIAEPSMIKNEPIEQEHLVITHVVESKEEPVELNVISTGPMGFGTAEYSGDLDNFVQNIHRSCSTNVSISNTSISRPKRVRKRKRLYIEESESTVIPKRIRKKRPQINIHSTLLTDAEIERQFGERLSPAVKTEDNDDIQENVNDVVPIQIEREPQTLLEKARAKLTHALKRGHGHDTFFLKIRSRDSKMIEVELAIYGTADWHSHRAKVLSKIEEALRGLRVSWTKIDIRVDDFDVQICTSPQTTSASSLINTNSSWFLKALSESGPLIVHIHDRRYPHRRHLIKCPCPQCSSTETISESSLPVIFSVSPAKTPIRHVPSPTILRKTDLSLNSITSFFRHLPTTFFSDLIHQHGISTVQAVTHCVLDLALIVSVHSALPDLHVCDKDYPKKYQEIIDPMNNNSENLPVLKSSTESDILTFYQMIEQNKVNIRNAHSMKNIILNNNSRTTSSSSNVIKTPAVILPTVTSHRRSLVMNRLNKRYRNQLSPNDNNNHNGMKQQAHFTPIIELKPILGGSTMMEEEPIRKVTKIISTNTIQKDQRRINTITTQEISPRVIRLSITKSSPSTSNSIRLIPSIPSMNKVDTSPLVPKQINIIKPLTSSSITPAMKLSNPILISKTVQQQPLIK